MSKQAKSVLESYPTFSEIFNDVHEKCKPNPQLYTMMGAYKNSLQWEGLTWPVDMLCNMMTESPFQGGYTVQNSKKNEGVNAKGEATVFDHMGTKYKVSGVEFLALIKVMACSWFEIPISEKAHKAYNKFRENYNIYRILD